MAGYPAMRPDPDALQGAAGRGFIGTALVPARGRNIAPPGPLRYPISGETPPWRSS